MNLSSLLKYYSEDSRTLQIYKTLEKGKNSRIEYKSSQGTQLLFQLAGLKKNMQAPILLIAQDKEEAAYWQNDLEVLLEKKELSLLFPDSYNRPRAFDKLKRSAVLQRTETVSKLLQARQNHPIVVTYPEALFERIVAPAALKRDAIDFKVEEEVDLDFIVEILATYGFKKVDFVYEPGQFSVRGGILDIYSYGNEYPYRVELFDNEVESIRSFDPSTQLSIKNIAFVSIVPNVNTRFSAEEKTSFLQVLPEGTSVWIKDYDGLMERIDLCHQSLEEFKEKLDEMKRMQRLEEVELMENNAFVETSSLLNDIHSLAQVHLRPIAEQDIDWTLSAEGKAQPSFNKNFKMLIRSLKENTKLGVRNFIFSENPKQIERFYNIFEDMDAEVEWVAIPHALSQGFIDYHHKLACYTDHQIFDRYHKYKSRQGFDQNMVNKIQTLGELNPGDYVTHIDHGIAIYGGLEPVVIKGKKQEAVKLIYRDKDILYVSIQSLHKIAKYTGKDGKVPKMHKLGSGAWAKTKSKTKAKIKEIAFDLIELYAKRKASKGVAFPQDDYLQNELEASFIYEDTPDQAKATQAVKEDMMKPYPMDRLVCGDVGFGKTEVAIRAVFKCAAFGKQAAVLVPTTILALQHAQSFKKRLEHFGLRVDYINRFRTTKEKNQIYKDLEAGAIDIIIGTHAILNKKVKFKDLGLLVIDEEQKFGVAAKEKLRNIKINVDTLTLTATPIPRTLQFSLMAARDLSVIATPPPNRQPIHTEVRRFEKAFIKEAIEAEVARGGQVFFLHNRVQSLEDMASLVRQICPNLDIAVAHGQMKPVDLEKTLMDFIKGYYDVLLCTNIIETGLDIANANTIIINDAQNFGLSDLHQLRGRVGRSNKKAYCYLLAPSVSLLSSDSRKRLQTIEQFSDLGSGLNIAMKDLDIRGAGNILGGEQSGFITNMGYETYQKILGESIRELKQGAYKDLFKEEMNKEEDYVEDVSVETDLEMMIPSEYVKSIEERLSLYQELNKLESEEDIIEYSAKLKDRFGRLPKAVFTLFDALRLRWLGKKLGMERIRLKSNVLRCYFIGNSQSPFFDSPRFQGLLKEVMSGKYPLTRFKQKPNSLLLVNEDAKDFVQSIRFLEALEKASTSVEAKS